MENISLRSQHYRLSAVWSKQQKSKGIHSSIMVLTKYGYREHSFPWVEGTGGI